MQKRGCTNVLMFQVTKCIETACCLYFYIGVTMLTKSWDSSLSPAGMMSPADYVRVTSTTAAKVFNIYPQKGKIAAGSDADIIVLDPSEKHTIKAESHHSRMDTNVYEGKIINGKVPLFVQ